MKKIKIHCLDGYYYVEDNYLCYSCTNLQEDISVEDLCALTIGQYNELVEKIYKHYPDYNIEYLKGRFI